MKKLLAFTLTELLIALTIIGAISAMTVPNIVNNYQRNAYVVQLRKVVNEIVSASDLVITEESKTRFAHTSYFNGNQMQNFINEKFKVNKTCNNTTGCFSNENYITINGDGSNAFSLANCDSSTAYLLTNGAAICAHKDNTGITYYIDINGPDKPNIGGRDMFTIFYDANSEKVGTNYEDEDCENGDYEGMSEEEKDEAIKACQARNANKHCATSTMGTGCYEELVNANWHMSY